MVALFVLYAILYALTLFFIGHVTLKICRVEIKDPYATLFASNIIGAILFAWAVACWRTYGMTVMNAIWIPLFGIIYYLYKSKLGFQGKIDIRIRIGLPHIKWIVLIIIFVFINHVFYLGSEISNPAISNIDSTFYIRLARYIYETGIESTHIDYLGLTSNTHRPYHYFVLWFHNGFNVFFKVENDYLVRRVLIFSIFFSNVYIGAIALVKTLLPEKRLPIYHYFTPFILFLIKPIGLGAWTAGIFGNFMFYFASSLAQMPKHSPITMMVLAVFILIQNRQYAISLMALLLASVLYGPTAPVVYVLLGILTLWAWIKKVKELYYLPLIVGILLLGYFVFFYVFQGKEQHSTDFLGGDSPLFGWVSTSPVMGHFLKGVVQVVLVWGLGLFFAVIPSLFVFKDIKQYFQKNYFSTLFMAISFIGGFLLWQLIFHINYNIDSHQFMTSFFSSVYAVFVFMWIIVLIDVLIKNRKKWAIGIIGLYGCALMYSAVRTSISEVQRYKKQYSLEYIKYIQRSKHKFSEYGALYGNVGDNIWFSYFSAYPGPYFQHKRPKDFMLVNIYEIPPKLDVYDLDKSYIPRFPFYQYVQKQKENHKYTNISQSKLDFVREYKINHIVVNKNATIDSIFLPYVKEKYLDRYSGEQLYFLDVPQK